MLFQIFKKKCYDKMKEKGVKLKNHSLSFGKPPILGTKKQSYKLEGWISH